VLKNHYKLFVFFKRNKLSSFSVYKEKKLQQYEYLFLIKNYTKFLNLKTLKPLVESSKRIKTKEFLFDQKNLYKFIKKGIFYKTVNNSNVSNF